MDGKLTERQGRWLNEAEKADREGNPFAAGIFALIAQPTERERRDIRDDAADGIGHGRE